MSASLLFGNCLLLSWQALFKINPEEVEKWEDEAGMYWVVTEIGAVEGKRLSVQQLRDTKRHSVDLSILLCRAGGLSSSFLPYRSRKVLIFSGNLAGHHVSHGPLLPLGIFTASQTVEVNLFFCRH